MTDNRTIAWDLAETLAFAGSGDKVIGVEAAYQVVANEVSGTWRWGTEHRCIVKSSPAADTFAFDYRLSSGDAEWTTFEDENDLPLYEVKLVEKTVAVYERVNQ